MRAASTKTTMLKTTGIFRTIDASIFSTFSTTISTTIFCKTDTAKTDAAKTDAAKTDAATDVICVSSLGGVAE